MARKAKAQYLASQQAAQVAAQQATNRAHVLAPPAKGVQRPPNPAPGVGTPPGQPQAPGAGGEFTPDASYLAEAAQRQFERSQAIQAMVTTGENDKTDTAEAIRRLLSKAPEQRQGIKEGANRAGLFYGGHLGKQLGEFEGNLAQQQGDINLDFQRRADARQAARTAIEQGMPLEEAAAMAEAATRQVDRDTTAASANALVPTPLDAAAAPAASAARLPSRAARARKVQSARRRPPARRRA